MPNPVFTITNEGNFAYTAAIATNTPITIATFRVGTNYTDPAVPTDTGLIGSTVYTGVPTSYTFLDEDTVGIRLELPADVGPFDFGEVGLFLDDGTMFARCSFGSPQAKYSSTISGIPNVWRITAVLRFTQAPALFRINTVAQNQILEVSHFGLISSPGGTLSNPNAVIVHEPTPYGDSVFMWAHSPSRWTISKYSLVGLVVLSGATATTLSSPDWTDYSSSTSGTFLIQSLQGEVRAVASISGTDATVTQPMTILPPGAVLSVYRADASVGSITNIPSNHYNSLIAQFNSQWGAPSGSSELDAKGWGQTPVPTVAAGSEPTDAEWLVFTNAVSAAAQLVGFDIATPLTGLNSNWSTDYWTKFTQYQSFVAAINRVVANKSGRTPFIATEQQLHSTLTRVTPWPAVNKDVRYTFPSAAELEAYFNGGGWLGFAVEADNDNYVQRVQEIALAQLQIIKLGAASAESTGPLKVRYEYGDLTNTDPGNSGMWGLTNTLKKVWSYTIVSSSGTGATATQGLIEFALWAARVSPTEIDVSFVITDNSDPSYTNDTEGGAPRLAASAISGRPDPAILTTPAIPHPTAVVLGTTSWV